MKVLENYKNYIGERYDDPEGMWEVKDVYSENDRILADVECVDHAPEENIGFIGTVSIEEVEYYTENTIW